MDSKNDRIYLDHAAATPVRREVLDQMMESLSLFANPSSIHKDGVKVRKAIEDAREGVASIIGASSKEIFFTSGSTEALNIAIQGVVRRAKGDSIIPHVVTSAIEHPSIIETMRALEREGVEVTYLVPGENGAIDPKDLAVALRDNTTLAALSLVNGEIGNMLPIEDLVKTINNFRRRMNGRYPYFLLDVTQATGISEISVKKLNADLLVFDGAKIGGLKGTGVLFVDEKAKIDPIIFGGGQERGLRPGTLNVLGIVSFWRALELAQKELDSESIRLRELSDHFISRLKEEIPGVLLNGDDRRAPHIINVCFPGIDAEWLVLSLDARGVSVSRGSACKSGKGNESEMLRIIKPTCAESSVRFSFGHGTTKKDLDRVIDDLINITKNVRKHSAWG